MAGFNKKPSDRRSNDSNRNAGERPQFRSDRTTDRRDGGRNTSFSDKPSFERKKDGDKPSFDRKPRISGGFNDRRSGGDDRRSSSFGDKPSFDRKPRTDNREGGFNDRRSGGDDRRSSSFGDKPSFDRKPRTDNREGGFNDRRSGGDDRRSSSFGDKPSFDRKPRISGGFNDRRSGGDDRRSSSFGDKPNFDRKPRADNREGGFNDRRSGGDDRRSSSFGDKPSFDRKPRTDNRSGGFNDRRSGGDDRRSNSFGDKPSFDRKPRTDNRDGGFNDRRSGGDDRRSNSFGDKPSFDRKPRTDNRRGGFNDRRSGGDDRRSSSFGDKPRFDRDANNDRNEDFDRRPKFQNEDDFFAKPDPKPRTTNFGGSTERKNNEYGRDGSFSDNRRGGDDRRSTSYSDKPKFDSRSRDDRGGVRREGSIERSERSNTSNYSNEDFDRNQQLHNNDEFFEKKAPSRRKENFQDEERTDTPRFEDHFDFAASNRPEFKNNLNENTEDNEDMRLNKYVALSGIASRRAAAEMIKNGEVTVNDEVVIEPGYRVQPADIIKHKGNTLQPVQDLVYLLLNKPKNFITTVNDEQGRKTVMDLVESATDKRIYPVGRLDRDTTGLLILTNDGDLARKLSHPSNDVKKIYQVILDRAVSSKDIEAIQKGLELEDGIAAVDAVGHIDGGSNNEIGIEIHIGKNRIVRRIFEHLGYVVEKLDRVYYAGLTKKDLPRGRYRHLTEKELIMLKHFI